MQAHPILRTVYDESARTLDILFATGKLNRYASVPADLGQGLRCASAKGAYFAHRIRNRFPATLLTHSGALQGPEGQRVAQLV